MTEKDKFTLYRDGVRWELVFDDQGEPIIRRDGRDYFAHKYPEPHDVSEKIDKRKINPDRDIGILGEFL